MSSSSARTGREGEKSLSRLPRGLLETKETRLIIRGLGHGPVQALCWSFLKFLAEKQNTVGIAREKALAHERHRFGHKRIHLLLKREGHRLNYKKLFQLHLEEKLTVSKRGGRKRAIGTRGRCWSR